MIRRTTLRPGVHRAGLFVMLALFAGAWVLPATAEHTRGAIVTRDGCGLLTEKDVEAAIGEPASVLGPRSAAYATEEPVPRGFTTCSWTAGALLVVLNATRAPENTPERDEFMSVVREAGATLMRAGWHLSLHGTREGLCTTAVPPTVGPGVQGGGTTCVAERYSAAVSVSVNAPAGYPEIPVERVRALASRALQNAP